MDNVSQNDFGLLKDCLESAVVEPTEDGFVCTIIPNAEEIVKENRLLYSIDGRAVDAPARITLSEANKIIVAECREETGVLSIEHHCQAGGHIAIKIVADPEANGVRIKTDMTYPTEEHVFVSEFIHF